MTAHRGVCLSSLSTLLRRAEGSGGLFPAPVTAAISKRVKIFSILVHEVLQKLFRAPRLKYGRSVQLDLAKLGNARAIFAILASFSYSSLQHLPASKPSGLCQPFLLQFLKIEAVFCLPGHSCVNPATG